MRKLRPLCLALVALVLVVLAPSAGAVPPTIVQPANGAEVAAGYTGPVHVTWLEAGEMKIEATGPNGYSTTVGPITVTPANVGGTYVYQVDPMNAPGTYTISAGRMDGSEAPAQVTVTVPAPPPSPGVADVTFPAHGAVFFNSFGGPIRVRWDAVNPAAGYRVALNDVTLCSYAGADLPVGGTTTCALPSAVGLGYYEIVVWEDMPGGGQNIPGASFFEVEPHLSIRSLTRATPLTFYPYVRDGYRDRARFRLALNKEANVTFVVRNRSGRVVRRVNLGFLSSTSWDWNGRSGGGALVPLGRYRVTLEARDDGELRRATREVVVTRGWRTRYGSKSYCGGCGPGDVAVRGNCYVEFDWFEEGDIFFDCWGGSFAGATWVFRVPATTFRISKTVRGTVMCCAPGDWASVGVRRNARTYVVAAGVSGWRSWQIRSVAISYAYRQRI